MLGLLRLRETDKVNTRITDSHAWLRRFFPVSQNALFLRLNLPTRAWFVSNSAIGFESQKSTPRAANASGSQICPAISLPIPATYKRGLYAPAVRMRQIDGRPDREIRKPLFFPDV